MTNSALGKRLYLIGAQKSGTTTLASLLDQVEGVSMSRPKEPMFFCFDCPAVHQHDLFAKGALWAQSQWERDRDSLLKEYDEACFSDAPAGDWLGDASTTYAGSRVAAERINEVFPDARIIMIVRDPIRRLVSAYWHGVRGGVLHGSLEYALKYESRTLLEFGFYGDQLDHYAKVFGRESLLVLDFEELCRHPDIVLRRACEFLGCAPPEYFRIEPENVTTYPRWPSGYRLLNQFRCEWMPRTTRSVSMHYLAAGSYNGSESSRLRKLGKTLLFRSAKPSSSLRPEIEDALRKLFRRHNQSLATYLGKDPFRLWGW